MKILIADDHPIVRRGLRQVLESDPSMVVTGEATNGDEALELARTFSTEDAVKFINGMLDGVRKKLDDVR